MRRSQAFHSFPHEDPFHDADKSYQSLDWSLVSTSHTTLHYLHNTPPYLRTVYKISREIPQGSACTSFFLHRRAPRQLHAIFEALLCS